MANASELKQRMQSVAETKKVTDAMYMISSVKMRRAKREVQNTEPYFNALTEQIRDLFQYIPETKSRYFHAALPEGREHGRHGILLVTSDKGLAGAYNQTALKLAESYIARHSEIKVFLIGEYGRQYFRAKKIPFEESFFYPAEQPTLWTAENICLELLEYYMDGRLDDINIIYTDYRGALPSECKRNVLLPLDRSQFRSTVTPPDERPYKEFYPDPDTVLTGIIPSYLTGFIYSSLVDSYCSEQQARMLAMSTASKNAEDMLKKLKMQYNAIRQAGITNEMIEITSGAKALREIRTKQREAKSIER